MAHQLACAFNFPYVIREQGGHLRGMTSAAAADAGIAAIIAEAGGCGLLEPGAVRQHLDGLGNALRAAGMPRLLLATAGALTPVGNPR